ncbi:MAG: hypothetical protein ACREMY_02880 [bacterium]
MDLISQLPESLGGVLLSTRLLASRAASSESVAPNSAKVANIADRYTQAPFTELPADVLNLLFVWNMTDPSACRTWLHKQIESSRWDALDIAGWKIEFKIKNGRRIVDSFDDKAVDSLLGIAYLLSRYADQLYSNMDGKSDLEDTAADRREGVLRALSIIAQRQAK